MVQHSEMMEDSSSIDFEDTGTVESRHMNATEWPRGGRYRIYLKRLIHSILEV